MEQITYVLAIDAIKPSTAPMARVAEYLLELANLLGEKGHVHFGAIKEGSTECCALVEKDYREKVEQRVHQVNDASGDVVNIYDRINKLLVSDNAVAFLRRVSNDGSSADILRFPGRELPKPEIYRIKQICSVEGIVVSVGGRDNSAHIQLEAGDGVYYRGSTSRNMAVLLAKHLYDSPIRITGAATWVRGADRKWKIEGPISIESFEVLISETLSEAISRIQASGLEPIEDTEIAEWLESRKED